MGKNNTKKYIRYSVISKEFHMYINSYNQVFTSKDATEIQLKSTQIYVESYDGDFLVKAFIDHKNHICELDQIQYAPKCNLTAYFFEHKDLVLFQYLAAILQIVYAEFPGLQTAEMRDELTLRVSERSRRYAYLYLSFFIAGLNNGETWFERYFKAEPVKSMCDDMYALQERNKIFEQKPRLQDILFHALAIEYNWSDFLDIYYDKYEALPNLRAFVKTFANRRQFDLLTYWYPAYVRSEYRIPYKFSMDIKKIPGKGPYYKIHEISTTPLIVNEWNEYKFYSGPSLVGTDEEIVIKNEMVSTMQLSWADVED
jgi:hypothetical protein